MARGVEPRHARSCRTHKGGRCNCKPTWRARVWSNHEKGRITRTFPNRSEAELWYHDAKLALKRGMLLTPVATTIDEAADELVAGMVSGAVRDRSGNRYKPSTIRSYRRALDLRLRPAFGTKRLAEIRRAEVQGLIESMLADDLSASTIKNTLDPLRVICRRAIRNDELTVDPTHNLEIPADRGRRERYATPAEADLLIDALPALERVLFATAMYTGLRRGELRELRCSDWDRETNTLRVKRGLDDDGTVIATKTYAGDRTVPIIPALRVMLAERLLRTGRSGTDLVFGRTATAPFIPSTVRTRARAAWAVAGLEPITLHEARHSTASMLRAAGVDFKLISAIMGHSSIMITQDRYTHLSLDNLQDAADALNRYLGTGQSRANDAPSGAVEGG